MRINFLVIASAAIIFSGCADPKSANEKNFKIAIQSYLDTAYPKCYIYSEFPVTIKGFDVDRLEKKLRALSKAGLVVETAGPTFNLTEEGKKFFKPNMKIKDFGGLIDSKSLGGFCFGKATVKDVTQFSEPNDMFGHRISHVNYTYEVSNLPTAWVKSPEILAEIKELKTDAESEKTPIKGLDVLILTNNGWVHENLFKK